jgi:hypothetical protein
VDKEVVQHKAVVLWRAKKGENVTPFDQIRLEMFFGSMVFTPVRTDYKPPGTDRVLNWAPYGLYQDQSYHLLSAAEAADKKKLDREATLQRRNDTMRRYRATEGGKQAHRRYETSEGRKRNKRQYQTSESGKRTQRQYRTSEGGKRTRTQADQVISAAGIKRAREFLEEHEHDERRAVQQKTNEPSCGVLGAWLGGS